MESCSWRLSGKPQLFSFHMDVELGYIKKKVFNGKRYSLRNLEKEWETLNQLAYDWHHIIQTKNLNQEKLDRLKEAIIEGAGGVWEIATSNLEKLSYYFEEAKILIINLINHPKNQIVLRSLSMLNDAFNRDEVILIMNASFQRRSKAIRGFAAQSCLNLKYSNMSDYLKNKRLEETDEEVVSSLEYALQCLEKWVSK